LLSKLLKGQQTSIVPNEHFEEDGPTVFREACKLGCEGDRIEATRFILSLRAFAALGHGQEPNAPVVKREAEVDWAR
jgi:hypothetical protein